MGPGSTAQTPGAAPARTPALPMVYINLDEDEVRRSAIEAAFAASSASASSASFAASSMPPLERLRATRWTTLSAQEQARWYDPALNARDYFKPLVDGEKGCYASHIAAWQRLLDSPAAALVVLEDDVRPLPGFTEVVNAIAALPADWDMVKLIGRGHEKPQHSSPLVAGFALIRYRRIPSLAAGYVLSRAGAQKLLARRQPFARPVDIDMRLWWESALRVRGVQPAVLALAQTSALSSIGARPKRAALREQWRKFRFKAGYSMLNLWHGWFGRP